MGGREGERGERRDARGGERKEREINDPRPLWGRFLRKLFVLGIPIFATPCPNRNYSNYLSTIYLATRLGRGRLIIL